MEIAPLLRDFQAEWESPAFGLFREASFSTVLLPTNCATDPDISTAGRSALGMVRVLWVPGGRSSRISSRWGQGIIYAVKPDGTLLWYRHDGYKNGTVAWTGPKKVGNGRQQFNTLVPAGDGIILAIKPDGTMLWYKHDNYLEGLSYMGSSRTAVRADKYVPIWEGGSKIGWGWINFRQIVALLPESVESQKGPH